MAVDPFDYASAVAEQQRQKLIDANAQAAAAQKAAVDSANASIQRLTDQGVRAALAEAATRNAPAAATQELTNTITEAPTRRIASLDQGLANRELDRQNRLNMGLGNIDATIGRMPLMRQSVNEALMQAQAAADAKAARAGGGGGGRRGSSGGLTLSDVMKIMQGATDTSTETASAPYQQLEQTLASQRYPGFSGMLGKFLPDFVQQAMRQNQALSAAKSALVPQAVYNQINAAPGDTYQGIPKSIFYNAFGENVMHPQNTQHVQQAKNQRTNTATATYKPQR